MASMIWSRLRRERIAALFGSFSKLQRLMADTDSMKLFVVFGMGLSTLRQTAAMSVSDGRRYSSSNPAVLSKRSKLSELKYQIWAICRKSLNDPPAELQV